jgi:hypothetical protein
VLEVRNKESYIVIPEGNIWNERMSGKDNFVQFDVLSGVNGIVDALNEASQKMVIKTA